MGARLRRLCLHLLLKLSQSRENDSRLEGGREEEEEEEASSESEKDLIQNSEIITATTSIKVLFWLFIAAWVLEDYLCYFFFLNLPLHVGL